jgi:hypothetical protein
MENGMLVELRERAPREIALFTFQRFVLTLIPLVTAVSCTTPGLMGYVTVSLYKVMISPTTGLC